MWADFLKPKNLPNPHFFLDWSTKARPNEALSIAWNRQVAGGLHEVSPLLASPEILHAKPQDY